MKSQLKIRTEYSFRAAYGPIEAITEHLKRMGCTSAAITDRASTFGHIAWHRNCLAKGIKPIFGVELAFIKDITLRERRQNLFYLSLLARSNAGLREIYSAFEEATENMYYVPRLPIAKLEDFSQDVIILSGNCGIGPYNQQLPDKVMVEWHPATNPQLIQEVLCDSMINGPQRLLPVSDNYMITPFNREAYQILIGRNAFWRPSQMHIMGRSEFEMERIGGFSWADYLASECNATIEPATNIKTKEQHNLFDMCIQGFRDRGMDITSDYYSRLRLEIDMIEQKGYVDYFIVIADMVSYAKQHMVVGPARGSSCGSLVCYLLRITDIDPIPHGLIFERFIDVTRTDLPDIDIDFQDDKRDMVFSYLTEKYGADKVARLGTVSRYKARMAIGETAKAVGIPRQDADQIADAIIKRADGDERANCCIEDTLADDDIGKEFVKRYPSIQIAAKLEGHARHHGIHAAGVIITNDPIKQYVARDARNNSVQIDKRDAEVINLMKIDCLGLRTLTVIADCLQQIEWTIDKLLAHPLDDDFAFKVLRDKLFCGIFQFEGEALQGLTRRVEVDRFTDLSALTALARPGPLQGGQSGEWCARRMEKKSVELLHPLLAPITNETYGLIIYQEQMLQVLRDIGQLSWEDATLFRRGINKKLGMEFFDTRFWPGFQIGANNNGIDSITARSIWETISGAGDYAFNKSHSVAYAMVSYWCMVLKGHFPLQFALANFRYTVDPQSIKKYIRELNKAGYEVKLFDAKQSQYNWSVQRDQLIGGLINLVGVGAKTAEDILERRKNGQHLTNSQVDKISLGVTRFDDAFECRTKFKHIFADPKKYGIESKIWDCAEIPDTEGRYVFFAKVVKWKIRSINEPQYLLKRNGLKMPNDKWLTMILEDDSGTIGATIARSDYSRLGQQIVRSRDSDWMLWRGVVKEGIRRIYVEKYKLM